MEKQSIDSLDQELNTLDEESTTTIKFLFGSLQSNTLEKELISISDNELLDLKDQFC